MSEATRIEWADSTFNPWIGCTNISPACDHCYAEAWAHRHRTGFQSEVWGPHGARHRTSKANWNMPRRWHRNAEAWRAEYGRPQFVFCASLADVFDNQVPEDWRADLWQLIRECDQLVWLILTKRPQNIRKMLPDDWGTGWPHVWLGTTVENQDVAARNIPHLLDVPAARRFLSCEPLLGPIDLRSLEVGDGEMDALAAPTWGEVINTGWRDTDPEWQDAFLDWYNLAEWPDEAARMYRPIDWVIAGGESGPDARPSHPDWFRALRDQCQAAGTAFHFKQWGEWIEHGHHEDGPHVQTFSVADSEVEGLRLIQSCTKAGFLSPDGEFADSWDTMTFPVARLMDRAGKAKTGRSLDGRTWDERPEA